MSLEETMITPSCYEIEGFWSRKDGVSIQLASVQRLLGENHLIVCIWFGNSLSIGVTMTPGQPSLPCVKSWQMTDGWLPSSLSLGPVQVCSAFRK